MGIEQFDQLSKVSQRTGQTVDLVDHNDIDLVVLDIGNEMLQGRAIG